MSQINSSIKVVKRLYKLIRWSFSLQDIKCPIGINRKERKDKNNEYISIIIWFAIKYGINYDDGIL